ncbi:hypothetical protein MPSEU_000331300 [Mayamaea pseudoterrestris]|nr:hypothetical protein MPSEU_000331300 [Mayamaea pseudoterrestris]
MEHDADASMTKHPSLSHMVIGSVDTLSQRELPQEVSSGWNDQPPLLTTIGARNKVIQETPKLLKGMVRKGIPPALRCAVWLSNVVQTVHPDKDNSYWHEYRTLAKVRALDGAYESVLQKIHTNDNDDDYWASMSQQPPLYGQVDPAPIPNMTTSGRTAQTRVLMALERVLGLDVAPLLPTLVALLLTHMSESYAFCTIRLVLHEVSWYMPICRRQYVAWCKSFGDVMRKLHVATAIYLEDRCVLDVPGLAPMFQDFFVGILPMSAVLRMMDIYTLEGFKSLFRFGVALLVLYKVDAAEQLTVISNATDWWSGMRDWGHSRRFQFELVVRKAYGLHGRGIRRQLRFPSRHILQRIIRVEEERVFEVDQEVSKWASIPVGLVIPDETNVPFGEEVAKPILAQSENYRQHLADWLPITLRMTNLDLLYSTNHHGRTLERFYNAVQHSKHTLLLCEAFSNGMSSKPAIIGMYASQTWKPSTKVYGDGACFLFRLDPDPRHWKWTPKALHSSSSHVLDNVDLENDNNQTALLEQFMVSTHGYISMGGNSDGSAGLRFNEDLTKGETSSAVGFENEPLTGEGSGSVFDVGLLEVYRLMRQIDGAPV